MTGRQKFREKLNDTCNKYPDKVAITYLLDNGTKEECTYSELILRIKKLAAHFEKLGLKHGDRVAVLVPLSTEAYITILALAYFGATSVVPDMNLHEKELRRLIEMADVQMIVTTGKIKEEKLSWVEVPVLNAFQKWTQINSCELKHAMDPDEDAIAILFSSGTTSQAKGVVIGYEQELNATSHLLEVVGTNEIRYLMLFPNSHISGLTDFLVLILEGGALATMENASASKLVEAFHEYKPNTFGMVPKVWETFQGKIIEGIKGKGKATAAVIFWLIQVCGFIRRCFGINLGKKMFTSINHEVFGGDFLNAHVGGGKSKDETGRFFWNLGYNWSNFYASTEANIPITVTQGIKYERGEGNVTANPNASIRIWNPDQNGVGEVQVKNNMMMKGYFRDGKLTKEAFQDGYFKTGDFGKIEKNQLFLLGRIKESIHLVNGEKVSPEDVEASYQGYIPESVMFAVVGIQKKDEGYDEIYIFVEGEEEKYNSVFEEARSHLTLNYQYKKLVYMETLPKTSIGKVKRYKLRDYVLQKNDTEESAQHTELKKEAGIEETVIELVRTCGNLGDDKVITKNMRLEKDLGIDSLAMFEICSELENIYGVNIAENLSNDVTISELFACIRNNGAKEGSNIDKYPLHQSIFTKFRFRFWRWMVCHLWTLELKGVENAPVEGNYILCSNHESHLDGMFIFSALYKNGVPYEKIACMAKKEHSEHWYSRSWLKMLGGIPVDRYGNPIPALKKCEVLIEKGYHVLIHPEGTRTRDGKMHDFKKGAGELSKKTGVPILPIEIRGAYEVFPATKHIPHLGKKHKIQICLGSMIYPEGKTEEQIMDRLKNEIVRMCNEDWN